MQPERAQWGQALRLGFHRGQTSLWINDQKMKTSPLISMTAKSDPIGQGLTPLI